MRPNQSVHNIEKLAGVGYGNQPANKACCVSSDCRMVTRSAIGYKVVNKAERNREGAL